MASFISRTAIAALLCAASTTAHSHVTNIVINGISYQGYDPTTFPYRKPPPVVVGWSASQNDNGFVDGDVYSNGDIICHKSAKPAGGHAPIRAGERVFIQWETWPSSHKGPVIDYLANCGESCEKADKTKLEFFKIDAVGLVSASKNNGNWGTDQLIANNNSWMVEIPGNIAPGNYVLRHEIIALHSAGQKNGAQNYPQCFNLQVLEGGSDAPSGTLGTQLYKADDPGLKVNIYSSISNYEVPGPSMYSGAVSIAQAASAITSSASAITGTATEVPGVAGPDQPGTTPAPGRGGTRPIPTLSSGGSGSTLTGDAGSGSSGNGNGNGNGNNNGNSQGSGSPFDNGAGASSTSFPRIEPCSETYQLT